MTLEVLHALYHRVNYSREEIEQLVCPLMRSDGVKLLRKTYERLSVEIDDLNEAKYTALKRLSEVGRDRNAYLHGTDSIR